MEKELIDKVKTLKGSLVSSLVEKRIGGFERLRRSCEEDWFSELCFCILTANASAEHCILIQKALKFKGFAYLTEKALADELKNLGYRFYNKRALYIVKSRKHLGRLKSTIESLDEYKAREWLVKNVKGFGYKEASHFLRNIGHHWVAILDRHIIKLMVSYKLTKGINALTSSKYLELERILLNLAKETQTTLSRLDLFLWYLATGKVLK